MQTEPGRQGAAKCRGSGRGASRVAPRNVCREGKGKTRTETPRARDQGTWEGGHVRTREGEQTGGRTGPRGQDRERGQRGSAATRIAPQCARADRRAEGQRRQGREEGVPRRHEGAGVGQKHKGAPQPSEPPAVRGGHGQGGAPRRDVQRGPGACVRLAYTEQQGVEGTQGRGGRGRHGGQRETKAAGGCGAAGMPQA